MNPKRSTPRAMSRRKGDCSAPPAKRPATHGAIDRRHNSAIWPHLRPKIRVGELRHLENFYDDWSSAPVDRPLPCPTRFPDGGSSRIKFVVGRHVGWVAEQQ